MAMVMGMVMVKCTDMDMDTVTVRAVTATNLYADQTISLMQTLACANKHMFTLLIILLVLSLNTVRRKKNLKNV